MNKQPIFAKISSIKSFSRKVLPVAESISESLLSQEGLHCKRLLVAECNEKFFILCETSAKNLKKPSVEARQRVRPFFIAAGLKEPEPLSEFKKRLFLQVQNYIESQYRHFSENGVELYGWPTRSRGPVRGNIGEVSTASVLKALQVIGLKTDSTSMVKDAILSLKNLQGKDGGWSTGSMKPLSVTEPTAICIEVLLNYEPDYKKSTSFSDALKWLKKGQISGAWGASLEATQPSVLHTAKVLFALRNICSESEVSTLVKPALGWLKILLNEDGLAFKENDPVSVPYAAYSLIALDSYGLLDIKTKQRGLNFLIRTLDNGFSQEEILEEEALGGRLVNNGDKFFTKIYQYVHSARVWAGIAVLNLGVSPFHETVLSLMSNSFRKHVAWSSNIEKKIVLWRILDQAILLNSWFEAIEKYAKKINTQISVLFDFPEVITKGEPIILDSSILMNELGNLCGFDYKASYERNELLKLRDSCFYLHVENQRIHSQVGRDAIYEIKRIIDSSDYLDLVSLFLDSRYRDHDEHQLRVAALGDYFLENLCVPGYQMKSIEWLICELGLSGLKEPLDVRAAWWTAALLHDHGYIIRFLLRAFPHLTSLQNRYNLTDQSEWRRSSSVVDEFKNILSYYRSYLSPRFSKELLRFENERPETVFKSLKSLAQSALVSTGLFMDFIDDKQILNHGLLGAVNLILRFEGEKSCISKTFIPHAARAIALHSLDQSIQFEKEPIAYLLALCDELQEWDRPAVSLRGEAIESTRIEIDPIRLHNNILAVFPKTTFRFLFRENEILQATGWNKDKMLASKQKAIGRLSGLFEVIKVEAWIEGEKT